MDVTVVGIILSIIGFAAAFAVSRFVSGRMRRVRRDKSLDSDYERLYAESQELPQKCAAKAGEQIALARQVMEEITDRRITVSNVYEDYRNYLRQQIREYGSLGSERPAAVNRGKERIERQAAGIRESERQLQVREKAAIDQLEKHGSVWCSVAAEWEKNRRKWAALEADIQPESRNHRARRRPVSPEQGRRMAQTMSELSARRAKEAQLAEKHERMKTQLVSSWAEHDKKLEDEKEMYRRELEKNRNIPSSP